MSDRQSGERTTARRPVEVLLIEDDRSEADLIGEMLAEAPGADFAVTRVDHLAAGLERLAEGGFDVVLLDFNLPDSTGLATFEAAYQVAPGVPILILTNVRDEELAARAVREGAQDYLVKREVEPRLLCRAICYAIERERADRALRESEERYALAVEGANDGIWDWNLVAGTTYFSPRWKSLLDLAEDEVGERPEEWLDRIHPDDRPAFDAALAAHLEGHSEHLEQEHRIRTRDGGYLWVLNRGLAVRDPAGKPYRLAGSMTDLTARKLAEEQLLHDAMHDALTGLPNRALFVDRLAQALGRQRRRQEAQFAAFFLDLDRFKNVNDSLGHSLGDELLVKIAERLSASLRAGDTVARLGGDEFALLLNDVATVSEATHLAERVQSLLAQKYSVGGHDVFTSASIGIAMSSSGYERPEEMLRDADIAMYRAKAAGRARCEVFDRDMHRSAVALLKLETDLRRAVVEQQFVTHYQPIVALDSGRILGFEALVRWQHPQRGMIRPRQFIAVAEETGLIVPLGWWVLEEACRQIRVWQDRFPLDPALWISVNVSGKLFREEGMVERVIALLEATRLDPESLRLEITESVVMDHGDAVLGLLSELRALGVKLQIDDFGTGYSSLSNLQRFRYDTLKIDRSFISNPDPHAGLGAIVQTIVALGNQMQMNVIAEGVETAEQARLLREIQCPHAQGYWFAEPLETRAAEAMLTELRVS